jgi:hypothetical protein
MGDVFYKSDLQAAIGASVILAVRVAQAQGLGSSVDFMTGIMVQAEYTARAFGLPWPAMVGEVRQAVGQLERGGVDDKSDCPLPTL